MTALTFLNKNQNVATHGDPTQIPPTQIFQNITSWNVSGICEFIVSVAFNAVYSLCINTIITDKRKEKLLAESYDGLLR